MRLEAVDRASKKLRPTADAALGQLDNASGNKLRDRVRAVGEPKRRARIQECRGHYFDLLGIKRFIAQKWRDRHNPRSHCSNRRERYWSLSHRRPGQSLSR